LAADRRPIHRRVETIKAGFAELVEKRGKNDGDGDNRLRFAALPDRSSIIPCSYVV